MISVVIPLYNKQNSIVKTLESILGQSYNEYEIVIVDDGSTDGSCAVVESYKDDRIKLYKKTNGGPASARNYGVSKASHEFVVFMDADDYFETDSFYVIVKVVKEHPDISFFCFNHYVEISNIKKLYSNKYKNGTLYSNFYSWCIGANMPRAGAAVFRRSILLQNPFNEYLRRYEDADSLFSLMRKYRIYQCTEPIMTYNCNANEASRPRKDVSEDFLGHLMPKGKGIWEKVALWQLYQQGLLAYPDDMKRLYSEKDFGGILFKLCRYHVMRKTGRTVALRNVIKNILSFY